MERPEYEIVVTVRPSFDFSHQEAKEVLDDILRNKDTDDMDFVVESYIDENGQKQAFPGMPEVR